MRNRKRFQIIKTMICLFLVLLLITGLLVGFLEFRNPPPTDTEGTGYTNEMENVEKANEPTPEEIKDMAIKEKIDSLSLHQKVCQMFIVTPETLTGVGQVISAGDTSKAAVNEYPVGGVVYFSSNLIDRNQTTQMISNMSSYSKESVGMDMFFAVDEEGGDVARCAEKLGTTSFSPMYEYRNEGEDRAYNNAITIGADIKGLGFNLDFAPIADVWSNPENKVIGTRAYSDNFTQAADLVAEAVKGYRAAGIACTLKHFPGHGDTSTDSHTSAARIKKDMSTLRNEEFLPFVSGINEGAQMVMMGHLLSGQDSYPASLSSYWITDILRGELGFEGVVITDALSMKALTDYYSNDQIVLKAVEAGNDLLLCSSSFKSMEASLEGYVGSGAIPEERIDESVYRILSLKYDLGLMDN